GDTVSQDQGLVTLESDKATLEVPSPFAGVVKELKVKLGDTLSEGSVVAMIEVADAAPAAAPKAEAAPAAPVKTAETGAKVEPVAVPEQADKLAQREIAQAQSHQPASGGAAPRTPPVEFNAEGVLPDQVPYATPAVRLFARELGVDLSQVKGSERGGRITREDVQRFVKAALAGGASASAPAAGGGNGLSLLPWPKVD